MKLDTAFEAQPPPHDLPAPPATYAAWTLTGLLLYGSVFLVVGISAAVWHELRCLRRTTEELIKSRRKVSTSNFPEYSEEAS